MIIYLPNISQQTIGGGWTFIRNLKQGLAERVQWASNWKDADIILITSASMVDANEIEEAHKAGVPIVFRVDNIPKKSRNKRGRIYDKMRRFGEMADHVVFQSRWAMEYAGFLTGIENGSVIYNGVPTDIFNTNGRDSDVTNRKRFLYVCYNRDENKRFPEAAYRFHMEWRNRRDIELTIVGNFSPELVDAQFDFFAGEKVQFIPPVSDPHLLADIYRDNDVLLFPAFADAAPNTVLEARACGLWVEGVNSVGGTAEMLDPDLDVSAERMCNEYYALFDLILNTHEIGAEV